MSVKTYKLCQIGDVVTGKTPPTSDKANYGKDFLFISPTELHSAYIINESKKMISKKGFDSIKSNTISGKSVLVGCIGWDMGNVGYTEKICATNQQINSITHIKDFCEPRYLYYWFLTKKKYLFSIASITRTPILSKTVFSEIQVPLPSIEKQIKITKVLSSLDDKIAINKHILAKIEKVIKSLYDCWFVQYDFPNENGFPYKSSGGEMVWCDELKRDIPKGWEIKKLEDLCFKGNVIPFPCNRKTRTVDLSVMSSNQMFLDHFNSSDNFSTNLFEMKKGDILFGSIRPYLCKAIIAPCEGAVAGTVHNIRLLDKNCYNFVASTICNSRMFEYANSRATGTKMPVVSLDSLMQYKVSFDKSVVYAFNKVDIVNMFAKKTLENEKLIAIRNRLLPLLINGQVDV